VVNSREREYSNLLDVPDLEASFRLDANKCTVEDESAIILAINSTTRLIH